MHVQKNISVNNLSHPYACILSFIYSCSRSFWCTCNMCIFKTIKILETNEKLFYQPLFPRNLKNKSFISIPHNDALYFKRTTADSGIWQHHERKHIYLLTIPQWWSFPVIIVMCKTLHVSRRTVPCGIKLHVSILVYFFTPIIPILLFPCTFFCPVALSFFAFPFSTMYFIFLAIFFIGISEER